MLNITSHTTSSDIIKHEAVNIITVCLYFCVNYLTCKLSLCTTLCQIVMACLAVTLFL